MLTVYKTGIKWKQLSTMEKWNMVWKTTDLVIFLILGYPRRIIFNSKAATNQVYSCIDDLRRFPLWVISLLWFSQNII